MEHSSDVVILTDLDGRRLYVSPAVHDILGYDADEFLLKTWHDYLNLDDTTSVQRQIREAQHNPELRALTVRVRHAAGHEIWIEAHVKHFRDRAIVMTRAEADQNLDLNCGPNGDEGFVVTLRDITRRREMEMALENANVELAALVWKDGLTGLANRRRFDEALQDAWRKALAGGWPLAVLMIDVDHFKQFNDCYGHQHGDFCLLGVSESIANSLFHPDDLAARYGGEEFAVILQQTNTDDAAHVAERIRHAVHSLGRPHAVSPLGVLTVSVGVAAATAMPQGDPAAIVKAADEALYISKREGRNRTTLLDVNWPEAAAQMDQQATA
jgi:diguanylate cyclase (GGDEF)-like protein/PAS domain S-box-containing protein